MPTPDTFYSRNWIDIDIFQGLATYCKRITREDHWLHVSLDIFHYLAQSRGLSPEWAQRGKTESLITLIKTGEATQRNYRIYGTALPDKHWQSPLSIFGEKHLPKNCVKMRVKKPTFRAILPAIWGGKGWRRVSRLKALLTNCNVIKNKIASFRHE